jgi:hypothetical protein
MALTARMQRVARGWIVGLVSTTVAAVSHSLAGGYHPGALSFGLALVFAGLLGTAVIGRRPSLPRLTIAVGASQLAFHLVFSLLGSGGGSALRSDPGMSGMAAMDGPTVTAVAASGHDHLADPAMWIAHAAAALLTLIFLRHAERAVWTMLTRLVTVVAARIVAARIGVAATPVSIGEPPRVPAGAAAVPRPAPRLLVASLSRRGPPLPSF